MTPTKVIVENVSAIDHNGNNRSKVLVKKKVTK